MKTFEKRIQTLERLISEIHARVVTGSESPSEADYAAAIEALTAGNSEPLAYYLRRGGEIPQSERPKKRIYRRRKATQARPANVHLFSSTT